MTSKEFLESSSGMKFVYPSVRLTNQKPGAFVSVSYTNQIALFPLVCCFCFVRAFSFQGQTKIALLDEVFVISRIIKVEVHVGVITLTETLIILDINIERILSFSLRHKMYVFKVYVNSFFSSGSLCFSLSLNQQTAP